MSLQGAFVVTKLIQLWIPILLRVRFVAQICGDALVRVIRSYQHSSTFGMLESLPVSLSDRASNVVLCKCNGFIDERSRSSCSLHLIVSYIQSIGSVLHQELYVARITHSAEFMLKRCANHAIITAGIHIGSKIKQWLCKIITTSLDGEFKRYFMAKLICVDVTLA